MVSPGFVPVPCCVRMPLVEFECREGHRVIAGELHGLPRRQCRCPIPRPDVVAGALGETPGRSEEADKGADRGALLVPTEDERQVVRIRESASATELPVDIGDQLVLRDRQRRDSRVVRASKERLPAHPHEGVHVHDDGVLATHRQRRPVIRFGLVARIEQQLIRVREAGVRRDAGANGRHAERIHAAALRVRTRRHEHANGQQYGPTQLARHFVAMFFQNRSRLSSPPNNVVKIVESANRMSPARSPFGGIQRNMLNSR